MSQNIEAERSKLQDIIKTVGGKSEANAKDIIAMKVKLDTINEGIVLNTILLKNYERKLEKLYTDIVSVEWRQMKAKMVLKSDIEFATSFKEKLYLRRENMNGTKKTWKYEEKILDSKREISLCEIQCKEYDKMIEERKDNLKLKEDCGKY